MTRKTDDHSKSRERSGAASRVRAATGSYRREAKSCNQGDGRSARPVLPLRVVCADGRSLRCASIDRRAIRIVDARVRRRVAEVDLRVAALRRGRRRAVAAGAAVRVNDAIAARHATVRGVVRRRRTADACRARGAVRVVETLVVRAIAARKSTRGTLASPTVDASMSAPASLLRVSAVALLSRPPHPRAAIRATVETRSGVRCIGSRWLQSIATTLI
jgi:hypothetical protein